MFLVKSSCPASQTELDLFNNAPTATDVERGYETQYQPTSGLKGGTIRFTFHSDQNDYVDFLHSYLQFNIKVTDADGSNLEENVEVATVNNTAHSMFSQIDLYLNDTLVTHSSNTAHYRAYLENLLSYGGDAKRSQLTLNGWYKDSAEKFDVMTAGNKGYNKRKALIAQSKHAQLICRLHTDITLQPKYMPNGVNVELRLTRNSNAFCLMAAAGSTYKLEIVDASFFCAQSQAQQWNPAAAHTEIGQRK